MDRVSFEALKLGPVIGVGTVGLVHSAELSGIDGGVAVKILRREICDDPMIRARFRREMNILEMLKHPHIIGYYGGGEHDGQLFYAMELLGGGNIRDLIDRYGALSWQEVASVGRQICSALQCAHNHGIVHRDLKPGNLFLDFNATVKLGDFGIARDTNARDIGSQGQTVGTHAYMAPEQITGDAKLNEKADLYSLGCVLFELLTGTRPFPGEYAVLLEQHLHKTPPRVSELVADCPRAFTDLVAQLLEKSPDARPFNARAVQGVLNEIVGAAYPDSDSDAMLDVAQQTIAGKLRPEPRPQISWRTFALILLLLAAMIFFASITNR